MKNRPCEFFDKQTLLFYIGYNKDGLRDEAKKEYRFRYGVEFISELEQAGWYPGKSNGIPGWFDPKTREHYLENDAITIKTMRDRKSNFGREPLYSA